MTDDRPKIYASDRQKAPRPRQSGTRIFAAGNRPADGPAAETPPPPPYYFCSRGDFVAEKIEERRLDEATSRGNAAGGADRKFSSN
jgi:hypothetical protein